MQVIPDDFNYYSTGDQYCGGRLDKPTGTFKTPNWPEKDYPAGVTCSWHIVAPKNQVSMFKSDQIRGVVCKVLVGNDSRKGL